MSEQQWYCPNCDCSSCVRRYDDKHSFLAMAERIAALQAENAELRKERDELQNKEFAGTLADLMNVKPNELLEEITRLQAELSTLRESMRWIPVSEKTPEPGEYVLLFHKDWSPRLGNWKDGVTIGLTPTPATHWMPLPKPPEDSSEREGGQ